MNNEQRIKLEKRITKKVVDGIFKNIENPSCEVTTGYEEEIEEKTNIKKNVLKGALSCDDAIIRVYKNDIYEGFVYLVFGNDGYDLISDYSICLEEVIKEAIEYAESYS